MKIIRRRMLYYFFFEVFFDFGFEVNLTSLDNEDFILAALFLCITFFFTARSANDIAFLTASIRPLEAVDFACRIAISNLLIISELTLVLRLEALRALFAVLVTGISSSIIENVL